MKILIINDRPWHHECYIHILDFCINSNIAIDILEAYEDCLNFKNFYLTYFKKKIRYVKGANKLKNKCLADPLTNIKYDKVFVITDNFIKTKYFNYFKNLKKDSITKNQFIFINHRSKIMLPSFPNHVDIRHFPSKKNNYAYPCANLISKEKKHQILSQEKQTNILVSANPDNINITKEIKKLNNINFNANIYWVSRSPEPKEFKLNNISYYKSLNQLSFSELLKKTHYVYVPEYHNKNYRTESTTGILGLAYSYLCQIIWEGINYNKHYKLHSSLEYCQGLEVNNNPDIDLVAEERRKLIQHRNKVFTNFLNK